MPTKTSFSPISWSTVKDSVGEMLTEAILSGKIKPGERLNESQLARDLKVSRAPIREALQQLQQQGLVVNTPRRGMSVIQLDDEDIQKINSVRLILEAEALRLARINMTKESGARLMQALQRLERSGSATPSVRARLDLEFHRTIWSLTGNEYLERILTSMASPVFAHSVFRILKSEKIRHILYSHRPLLAFLQGETEQTAEVIMAEHLRVPWGQVESRQETAAGRGKSYRVAAGADSRGLT
jgi:DNA-binding GntR family transcriptional regulator